MSPSALLSVAGAAHRKVSASAQLSWNDEVFLGRDDRCGENVCFLHTKMLFCPFLFPFPIEESSFFGMAYCFGNAEGLWPQFSQRLWPVVLVLPFN